MRASIFYLLLAILALFTFAACPSGAQTGDINAAQRAAAKSDTLDMDLPFGLRLGMPMDEVSAVLEKLVEDDVAGYFFGSFFAPFIAAGEMYIVDIELILGENMSLGQLKLVFQENVKRKKLIKDLRREFADHDYYPDGDDHLWISNNKGIRLSYGDGADYLLYRDYRAPLSFTNELM